MARQAQQVAGVYEKVKKSGVWYIRYRVNGKLVRKMIGTRAQAIDALEKVRYIRSSGDGVVPTSATQVIRTNSESREVQEKILFSELCDDLLKHIQDHPEQYRDQHNPPIRMVRLATRFSPSETPVADDGDCDITGESGGFGPFVTWLLKISPALLQQFSNSVLIFP